MCYTFVYRVLCICMHADMNTQVLTIVEDAYMLLATLPPQTATEGCYKM